MRDNLLTPLRSHLKDAQKKILDGEVLDQLQVLIEQGNRLELPTMKSIESVVAKQMDKQVTKTKEASVKNSMMSMSI